jgi:ParB family transcriptional regulator, chromosome partitioning protein
MEKRPALGKGLSALIPDVPEPHAATTEVEIDRLSPNIFQPRAEMDDERLDDLAQSIRANGIIQPIIVRRTGDRFQIIAGERRWRAAKKAGLERVPVVVKDVASGQERSLLEMALVENIQRENLNPIDEALAYKRLADDFDHTQEQIAIAVGKDRATIANILRLLKLPEDVRRQVASGTLSMGHARAILGLASPDEQRRLAAEVVSGNLSVRDAEGLVKSAQGAVSKPPSKETPPRPVDVHTRAAEERLRMVLGSRVRIVRRGTRGRIEIDFVSEDELIRLFDQLAEGNSGPPSRTVSGS